MNLLYTPDSGITLIPCLSTVGRVAYTVVRLLTPNGPSMVLSTRYPTVDMANMTASVT